MNEIPNANTRYIVDTCSFTAMRRVYPQDVFPGAWAKLDELAHARVLLSTEDVFEEIKVQDDEVLDWAKAHTSIFLPLDDAIQTKASAILGTHPTLVDLKRRKSGADPFVIASSIVHNCTVVTEERPSGGPHKAKIPDVCKAYRVPCITVLETLRREGLRLL